jgi:hypothetical protein
MKTLSARLRGSLLSSAARPSQFGSLMPRLFAPTSQSTGERWADASAVVSEGKSDDARSESPFGDMSAPVAGYNKNKTGAGEHASIDEYVAAEQELFASNAEDLAEKRYAPTAARRTAA